MTAPFKRVGTVLLLFCGMVLASPASAAPKRHALAKVGTTVAAPVTHPKRTFKQVVGSVVFVAEAGNDVVLTGLTALDKAASMELKHNPFHYAAVVDGKIDAGLEYAEEYFFGLSGS